MGAALKCVPPASEAVPIKELFNAPDPLRRRFAWADAAPEGWYLVSGNKSAPCHLVVHDIELARRLLDRLEPEGLLWKPASNWGIFDRLLTKATTKATPADWPRAREAVEEAIGQGDTFDCRFSGAAMHAGARLVSLLLRRAPEEEADLKRVVEAAACTAICTAADTLEHNRIPLLRGVCGEDGELEVIFLEMWRAVRCPPEDRGAGWQEEVHKKAARFSEAVLTRCRQAGSAEGGRRETLLSRLAAAEGSSKLSEEEICGNVHSFMIAGFEAINCITLFSLLHLSRESDMQNRIAEEVRSTGGVQFGYSEAARCPLLCAVVRETLRLYPPVMSLPRMVRCPRGPANQPPGTCHCGGGLNTAGLDLPGAPQLLPHGSVITVCTAACSLMAAAPEEALEEPWAWLPERRPEGCSQSTAFGCGPRRCPGGQIALGLVRVMVGSVCAALRLSPGSLPAIHATADGRCGWEAHLRQVPTLCLRGPALARVQVRAPEASSQEEGRSATTASALLKPCSEEGASAAVALSLETLAASASRERCWILIDNKVYDVTEYLEVHPGGAEILLKFGGGCDASHEFARHHSEAVRSQLSSYLIGDMPA